MSFKFLFSMDRTLGIVLIFFLSIAGRILGWVMRRDHDLKIKGDILVIKMLGGGSLVMAFPALLGIRRKYPDAKMRLFTSRSVKPFAETLGIFDKIVALDDKSFVNMVTGALRCIAACFGNDTVIDLEVYSYLSSVLSLMTCARNRIGFFFEEVGYRERLHSHRIFFHPGSPLYLHYDRVAELVGAKAVSAAECGQHIKGVLGLEKTPEPKPTVPRIAVGCGCSDLAVERKLAPEQWARNVFAAAADKNRDVVFLGVQKDSTDAEKVTASVKALGSSGWGGKLENLCGTMILADSLRMLASCEEFWGIESSLLHYARLFGLRCKSFFGPTHPMRLRPVEGLVEDVYYRKTICSPCIHLVSVPPCHGNNLCMKWLFETVDKNDPRQNWIPVTTE